MPSAWVSTSQTFATSFTTTPPARWSSTCKRYDDGISARRILRAAAPATAAVPTALRQRVRARRGRAILQKQDAGLIGRGDLNTPVHEAEPHCPSLPTGSVLQSASEIATQWSVRLTLKVARDVHHGRWACSCLGRLGYVHRLHKGTYPHHCNIRCREWQKPELAAECS